MGGLNEALGIQPDPIQHKAENVVVVAPSGNATSVMTRYTDAYMVGRTITAVAFAVKAVSLILGALLLVGGVLWGSSSPGEAAQIGMFLSSLFGILIGVAGYIMSVLVAAIGQQIKASLDCAVNSSPFLCNEERAKVMSL